MTTEVLKFHSPVWTDQSLEYIPSSSNNDSCLPISEIFPLSKTAMMSAFLTVESLCAIINVVLPLDILSMDLFKAASVSLSTLLVASSRISIGGVFQNCSGYSYSLPLAPR